MPVLWVSPPPFEVEIKEVSELDSLEDDAPILIALSWLILEVELTVLLSSVILFEDSSLGKIFNGFISSTSLELSAVSFDVSLELVEGALDVVGLLETNSPLFSSFMAGRIFSDDLLVVGLIELDKLLVADEGETDTADFKVALQVVVVPCTGLGKQADTAFTVRVLALVGWWEAAEIVKLLDVDGATDEDTCSNNWDWEDCCWPLFEILWTVWVDERERLEAKLLPNVDDIMHDPYAWGTTSLGKLNNVTWQLSLVREDAIKVTNSWAGGGFECSLFADSLGQFIWLDGGVAAEANNTSGGQFEWL